MSVTKATKRKNPTGETKKEEKQQQQEEKVAEGEKEKEKGGLRFGPLPKFPHQRVWSRAVVIVGVLVYVWYSSGGKETTLAKFKEVLPHRGQKVDCDDAYLDEIKQYPSCAPAQCGRYVSDKLVTANEAETLLKIAKRGIALRGSAGGASILDLHSGALSAGEQFINVYSLEEAKKIFNPQDLMVYKIVKAKIQHAIAETFGIDAKSLYLTHPTFFSKLTNLEPKTDHDEYWHVHIDKVTYESFHYTSLLYLSDYSKDFKGGRLVFLEGTLEKPTRNVTVEPRRGRVAMFTSGAENPHFVERVSAGVRYAITVSFTCDPSKGINDPVVR